MDISHASLSVIHILNEALQNVYSDEKKLASTIADTLEKGIEGHRKADGYSSRQN